MPSISLIIATFNRAASLAKTLDSVTAAVHAAPGLAIEIVIVDNNSCDETPHVVASWKETATFPVTTLEEKRQGVSSARNAGLRAGTGEIFAFTDDDCRLNLDYFTALHRHYAVDNAPVMRGGRVELGDASDLAFSIKTGDGDIRMEDVTFPGGFVMGANFIITRTIFERIGYFDEHFGGGAPYRAAEDSEYVYRAHRAGISVEYVPDIIVHHFHGRKDIESIRRLNYGYQLGNGAMYAKHFGRHLGRHFYWDLRKSLHEFFRSGPMMDTDLGLSYRALLLGNLHGMALYSLYGVARFLNALGKARV